MHELACAALGILKHCSIAELILFVSLYRVRSLHSHPTHYPLQVDTILIFELINTDVKGTERSTPPYACAAVDKDGRAVGREVESRQVQLLSLARLSLANREKKLKDMLAARGDPIVWPGKELVVHDSTLCAL